MNEAEAINRLSYLKSKAENALSNTNSNCEWAKKDVKGTIVALDMAIKALEKQTMCNEFLADIETYNECRKLGTVEELKNLKYELE